MISVPEIQTGACEWYCVRTKPKHEHIAALNLARNLGLEVFNPRLRLERVTRRGVVVRVREALFPCYIFVRCSIGERLDEIRHTSGISSIVHFGGRIPTVAESVIDDLRECFGTEEMLVVNDCPAPGDTVTLATGPFQGMRAIALRAWPAKRRVQVLLDILGRPTPMEVDLNSVSLEKRSVADLVPSLAARGVADFANRGRCAVLVCG
jgi:transcriptional antiterminator RfaH